MREILPTYEVVKAHAGAPVAIRCLLCGLSSQNPHDVDHRYCGRCHVFHDDLALARAVYLRGEVPHACTAWRLVVGGVGFCAVCARVEVDPSLATGERKRAGMLS